MKVARFAPGLLLLAQRGQASADRAAIPASLAHPTCASVIVETPLCPTYAAAAPPKAREKRLAALEQLLSDEVPLSAGAALERAWEGLSEDFWVLLGTRAATMAARMDPVAAAYVTGEATQGFARKAILLGRRMLLGGQPDRKAVLAHAHRQVRRTGGQPIGREDVGKAIERVDARINWFMKTEMVEQAEGLLLQRQALLASWPVGVIDISHQHLEGDPCIQQQIDGAVAKLVTSYPKSMRPSLDAFVSHMRHNVFAQQPRRAQVYLQGAPGTGKTRFVHQLAEALGLPLIVVRLPRSPNDDPILKLLGPQGSLSALSMFQTQGHNDPCEAVGALACAMFEAEVLNPIIFVEEAGETLNQPHYAALLKDVLDPDNLALRLRSLDGLQLDFSQATVIFAGNAPLTDAVLQTKLKQVVFQPLTRARKAQILADALRGEVHGNNARLRSDLLQKLEYAMARLAPLLLDADAAHDVPGARHLIEAARELTKYVVGRLTIGADVPADDARELIDAFYTQREAAPSPLPPRNLMTWSTF